MTKSPAGGSPAPRPRTWMLRRNRALLLAVALTCALGASAPARAQDVSSSALAPTPQSQAARSLLVWLNRAITDAQSGRAMIVYGPAPLGFLVVDSGVTRAPIDLAEKAGVVDATAARRAVEELRRSQATAIQRAIELRDRVAALVDQYAVSEQPVDYDFRPPAPGAPIRDPGARPLPTAPGNLPEAGPPIRAIALPDLSTPEAQLRTASALLAWLNRAIADVQAGRRMMILAPDPIGFLVVETDAIRNSKLLLVGAGAMDAAAAGAEAEALRGQPYALQKAIEFRDWLNGWLNLGDAGAGVAAVPGAPDAGGGGDGETLRPDRPTFEAGQPIPVNFSNLPGTYDWITIVPVGTPDDQFGEWHWSDGSSTPNAPAGSPQRSGRIVFQGLPPGDYEVRLYHDWPNGGYRVRGRRPLTVVAAAPTASPGDAGAVASAVFAGTWESSTWGTMTLTQNGRDVTGSFTAHGGGTLVGVVESVILHFSWHTPGNGNRGEATIRLLSNGDFEGYFCYGRGCDPGTRNPHAGRRTGAPAPAVAQAPAAGSYRFLGVYSFYGIERLGSIARIGLEACQAECDGRSDCRTITWREGSSCQLYAITAQEVEGQGKLRLSRDRTHLYEKGAGSGRTFAPGIRWTSDARWYREIDQRLTFTCPAGGTFDTVYGTDVYADTSSICTAAVHAGAITREAGGKVTIEIRPGESSYVGSTRNGVTSRNYTWGSDPRSFVVIGGGR